VLPKRKPRAQARGEDGAASTGSVMMMMMMMMVVN
jgi:hypothetical protein